MKTHPKPEEHSFENVVAGARANLMRLGLSRKDVDDELAKGPPNKALGQESSSPTPVKTTIRLPRRLWRDVRIRALDEGRDFQEVVAAALELYLKTTKREGAR